MGAEGPIVAILVILFLGLLIPELTQRIKIPFVTSIILVGALFGPYGLGFVERSETIDFFGFLGLAFLMLMAGLETKTHKLVRSLKDISILALMNAGIPFFVGIMVAYAFDLPTLTAIILGIIFSASSVSISVPAFKEIGLERKRAGQDFLAAIILMDIISLILLALVFQGESGTALFPLPLYFVFLIAIIVILKLLLPRIYRYFAQRTSKHSHIKHEEQLRLVLILLIAVVLGFNIFGIHPILSAYLVGIFLADTITSKVLLEKIHTIGYGLFIPIFFFVIGTEMDLSLLRELGSIGSLLVVLLISVISAKFISGFLAAKITKFSNKNALIFGTITTTSLTTTLAAAFTARDLNIINTELLTSILILTIITTLLAPMVIRIIKDHKFNR